ncbi:hypothetical protein ABS71_02875 [bacterium SCN 62-11]|nr:MAG: hypothetical protein ABS71_02875 [bacterium SCN 62-11]
MLPRLAAILALELQIESRFLDLETAAFLREGRFQLCFQGPRGVVSLRNVTVRLPMPAGVVERSQVTVALGIAELEKLVLGPAWLEKF